MDNPAITFDKLILHSGFILFSDYVIIVNFKEKRLG